MAIHKRFGVYFLEFQEKRPLATHRFTLRPWALLNDRRGHLTERSKDYVGRMSELFYDCLGLRP